MDSAAGIASVGAVSTLAAELAKRLFKVCQDVKGAEKEAEEVANNVSLLSIVLEELQDVLRKDGQYYRPELVARAKEICERCESIFNDIEKAARVKRGITTKKSLMKKLAWCFKKERVKLLQASLESLKSTLNVLLHVVVLAKTTMKPSSHDANTVEAGKNDDQNRQERRLLASLVLDNRLCVEKLEKLEAEGQKQYARSLRQEFLNTISSPTGASEDPFDQSRPEETHNYQKEFVYATVADDKPTNNQHWPKDGPGASSRNRPSHDSDDASDETSPEKGEPSAEELKLIKCLLYDPRTSRLVFRAVPHRKAETYALGGAPRVFKSSGIDKAESVVDFLLEDYTYVFSGGANDLPKRSTDFQADNSPPDESYTYYGHEPETVGSQAGGNPLAAATAATATFEMPNARKGVQKSADLPYVEYGDFPDSSHRAPKQDNPGIRTYGEPHYNVPYSGPPRESQMHPEQQYPGQSALPGSGFQDYAIPSFSQNQPKPSGYRDGRTYQDPYASSDSETDLRRTEKRRSRGRARARRRDRSESNSLSERQKNRQRMFSQGMDFIEEVVQRSRFAGSEFSKAQEERKNLERELRFERAKEQIRKEAVESLKAQQDKDAESRAAIENSKPLILKDCLGRSFCLPIQACKSWQTMRSFITSCFTHIDALNPQITQGNYDLLGPTGDIILPEVWEIMVQPGWVVELRIRSQTSIANENMFPGLTTPKSSIPKGSASVSGSFHRHRPSLRGWLNRQKSSGDSVKSGNT